MEADVELAARQLARMRGMNAAYHRRFFGDVRFVLVVILLLFAGGLGLDRHLYLAVPFVALFGATQTAFDASYLVFSRQYSSGTNSCSPIGGGLEFRTRPEVGRAGANDAPAALTLEKMV